MASPAGRSRWWLVLAAAMLMGAAGTYQFAWSSVRLPLGARIGATEAALGTVFTLFVTAQTLSQYPAGWVRDRYGPRMPLAAGAVLMVGGYAGVAFAPALPHAALSYVLGGAGSGAVYTVAINTPVKWFDERRGLATGVVTMSYSGLSFLLIPGLRRGMSVDFEASLLALAVLAGGAALLSIAVIRDPGRDEEDPEPESIPDDAYAWRDALQTWQFWVMYAVFVVVNGVGLMLIGKVVALAAAMELPDSAGTYGASLVALADAAGIVVVGAVSDRIGRERALGASLVLSGVALAAAIMAGGGELAVGFVALVGAAAFFRSPTFSLMPTMVGEYYGAARSSENYALLYTAKLWGGVFGGTVASALVLSLGWSETFVLGAVLLVVAGATTFALRPVDATGSAG